MITAFPPLRARASVPVPASTALAKLQTYLEAVTAPTGPQAHLLPNATLQGGGPAAQGGGAAANLVIHNLKRVEAGLRGEWLAPSLELDGAGAKGEDADADVEPRLDKEAEAEGWVDLDTYRREQSIEEGEVGPADTAIRQEGELGVSMSVDVAVPDGKVLKTMDKEARKREKMARRNEERKNRVNKQQKTGS
jgi:hypothetical protein